MSSFAPRELDFTLIHTTKDHDETLGEAVARVWKLYKDERAHEGKPVMVRLYERGGFKLYEKFGSSREPTSTPHRTGQAFHRDPDKR